MSSPRRAHWGLLALLYFLPLGWSQAAVQGQTQTENTPEVTRILFVFDASNSMNAFWGRRRKWDVARELLSASLDSLYGIEGLELGLRVYGHGTKHVQGKQDCDDTELVVPIGPGRNLIIQQELKKLKAQGTTPIARSLLAAADDFAATSGPGKNVILLITDGIEACDEDPCAVSRALQAQGVTIKPFIIGIGLEEKYQDTFQCVGRYFDASKPEVFGEVLNIVIDQAIHRTTAQLDLFNTKGEPTQTNLPFEFIEKSSGHPVLQAVHTMNSASVPDTLSLNPVPRYDLVVHTLPPVVKEGLILTPRIHNHIEVDAPTGFLDLSTSQPRSALNQTHVRVTATEGESCTLVHTQKVGTRQRYLCGTYDLEFATLPPVKVEGVTIGDGRIVPVAISEPGSLRLNTRGMGYGGIFLETEAGRKLVVPFDGQDPSGQYDLQPGRYVVLFRAKRAPQTDLSVTHPLTLRSGGIHNIDL
jgi:Ca-activated chloride channel family protein